MKCDLRHSRAHRERTPRAHWGLFTSTPSCPSTLLLPPLTRSLSHSVCFSLYFCTPLHAFQLDAHTPPPPATLRCALCQIRNEILPPHSWLSCAQVSRLFCCLSTAMHVRAPQCTAVCVRGGVGAIKSGRSIIFHGKTSRTCIIV